MGVSGLKQLLKPLMSLESLEGFANKRIGQDVSGWIHSLALRRDVIFPIIESHNYMPLVQVLVGLILDWRSAGIVLIPVFDGKPLDAKSPTHADRARRRETAIQEYLAAIATKSGCRLIDLYQSPSIVKLAPKTFERTEELSEELMNALRENDIEYYRTPFGADAQLAFFNRHQYIDAIATCDADLIAFGTHVIIFPPGSGIHVLREPQLIFR